LASRAGDYVIGSTVTVDGGVAFATPAMRDLHLED
jgi:2-deoxy-D-gluconate 3-dehydrogenase